ncbi:MAG TPA: type II toxin-antitoxin system VapC family toxin [Roseiflexaceae bacterium]|nr:type II toxin-antitoxin system VapC family toxin [Roseiflexaceae bacterium]
MNIVDSSGWLEFFADGPNATFFAPIITDLEHLIVPEISVYEVFKRVLQQRSEADALQAVAVMAQGQIVELNQNLTLSAAKLSIDLRLPMADSMILATAQLHGATLWTQDADFKDVAGVQYVEKK